MDNLYYEIITPIISFISLIGFVAIISFRIITKTKPKICEYILLLIFTLGMYLYFPLTMYSRGYSKLDAQKLEQAVKFSINPYEKRLCYMAIADVYRFKKDGEKIIEYKEKALHGAYGKYPEETFILAFWYSIKGDYNKVMELKDYVPNCRIPVRSAYIQNGEYEKALATFGEEEKSAGSYLLRAALYKELGDTAQAEKYSQIADEQIKKNKFPRKNLDSYKTVEAFKNFINEKRTEYGFPTNN
ncbi:hypothetical protein IKP85_04725 [bacterium]|nr:hypothetical protein [bacterium]